MQTPIIQKKNKRLTLHNHERIDPYYWLNERTNPDVRSYVEAENAFTEAGMAHTKDLQKTLYEEMRGRIQENDEEVPEQNGPYEYFSRTEKGKQYKIYCRQSIDRPETMEVLLDLNTFAETSEFVQLGVFKPSPDHKMLAYSLDLTGAENYTVFFKNLGTGELLSNQIQNTGYYGEWAKDNQSYFYTTKDEAWRDHRLHRYSLGAGTNALVYEETDELFSVSLSKTKDQAYILLKLNSIKTSECLFLDANRPEYAFQMLKPRTYGIEYGVEHHNGLFYIWTNEEALNFKIVTAPVDDLSESNWQEFASHHPDIKIDSLDCFENHLVIYQRSNGLRTITVMDFRTSNSHSIEFPEEAYTFRNSKNPEFKTSTLRFTYSSPVTPESVIDYEMDEHKWTVRKRTSVLGGYNPDDYIVERIFAPADDGAQVPMTLLYKKGIEKKSNNPCMLYGYGSYGSSNDPRFDINIFSLVDRGFIFASANIRGGGEMGRSWYENGKFLHKKNTFTDFIACGRHLAAQHYTRPEKLAIMGRSAGGLLIGSVINLAPDLCRAAVAHVPFVDVITTMLDTSIPLTVGEFEEWGNPLDEEYYWYMLSYSPYDNVEAKEYPHLLITSGLNDPRVQYWEPTKWVAKLRDTGHGPNRLFLKTNMGAGHAGASGRFDYLKEQAFNYAFIIDTLEIID
jgi:oligopeptidase B